MRCGFYGEDFCILNTNDLRNNTFITIGVYCDTECDFRIQAQLTNELLLDTGTSYKLFFEAEQERLIRF
jgi:hypothetical protein